MNYNILLLNMLDIKRRSTRKVQSNMSDNLHGDVNSSNSIYCSHDIYNGCPILFTHLLHIKALRHDFIKPVYMNNCYRPILKKKTSKSHKLIHIP